MAIGPWQVATALVALLFVLAYFVVAAKGFRKAEHHHEAGTKPSTVHTVLAGVWVVWAFGALARTVVVGAWNLFSVAAIGAMLFYSVRWMRAVVAASRGAAKKD